MGLRPFETQLPSPTPVEVKFDYVSLNYLIKMYVTIFIQIKFFLFSNFVYGIFIGEQS